jgi:hypothetical protein
VSLERGGLGVQVGSGCAAGPSAVSLAEPRVCRARVAHGNGPAVARPPSTSALRVAGARTPTGCPTRFISQAPGHRRGGGG